MFFLAQAKNYLFRMKRNKLNKKKKKKRSQLMLDQSVATKRLPLRKAKQGEPDKRKRDAADIYHKYKK